jgi:hypothetical protein
MNPPAAEEALVRLSAASTYLHPDDIAPAVQVMAADLGLADAVIYLADLEQRSLVRLPSPDEPRGERATLGIDSTEAGRAYRIEKPVVVEAGGEGSIEGGGQGRVTVWLPLLDSAERLGTIGATVDADGIDDRRIARWAAFASSVGELIANKMAYGDVLTTTRRTRPATIAAEMRWAILPPLTFTGRNISVSGVVLPAYEIAGDTFDYAVNGDTAHLAIIDAVGHDLEAARIANLAVGVYRNARRNGQGTIEKYRLMDTVVAAEFGIEKFATAQLGKLDLGTGRLLWLNAGHPQPMVIRGGKQIDLESEVCLPVGLGGGDGGALADTSLEPGDIVLFFTDGITEARSSSGEEFGRERLAEFVEWAVAAGQTPAETVRLLSHAVLEHQRDVLQDDATLLLVQWSGPQSMRAF